MPKQVNKNNFRANRGNSTTRGSSRGGGGGGGGSIAASPRASSQAVPNHHRASTDGLVSSTRDHPHPRPAWPAQAPTARPVAERVSQPAAAVARPPQYSRTRPCLYCGKTFLSPADLTDHEEAEAAEFEKEAVHFESENKMKMGQPTFERYSPSLNQVIDRTSEEFGHTYTFPQDLKIRSVKDGNDNNRIINYSWSTTTTAGGSAFLTNGSSPSMCSNKLSGDSLPAESRPPLSLVKAQYNNHTSQYTSLDPVCPLYQGTASTPPPAHEDQTIAHGFFPPPPPLPVPQFAQVCHKRSDAEFPNPNEDKTYTNLQSNEESSARSTLLQVNSLSPSREVLDLSMPKTSVVDTKMAPLKEEEEEKEEQVTEAMSSEEVVDYSVKPDSSQPKLEEDEVFQSPAEPGLEAVKVEDVKEDQLIVFEPSSMPSMPEAVISYSEARSTGLYAAATAGPEESGIPANNDTDKYFSDEYSGLINLEDEPEESVRSQSPHQFDDPNRIDCKHCGMVFSAPHVRRFHEQGHNAEHEEYDGELTRLFCGYCGKVFKKATYRMLHEKGHTGELSITCHFCERKFRWESELRSHRRMCTAENPAKPPSRKPKFPSAPKNSIKDDWIDNHPSMPTGWKLRTRPRPTQEGQLYFIFLSPEGQVFHSRKSVLQHMEKTGGYSLEDINKVKKSAKTGPRGRGRGVGGGLTRRDRVSHDIDIDHDEGSREAVDGDLTDPSYTPSKKEPETEEVEGKKSLRLRRKKFHLVSA